MHRYEPTRVPGFVAPAVLAYAAALIDLQVVAGAIIAVEIEQDADAIMAAQVGIARARLDWRRVTTGRMCALERDVEKILILGEMYLGRALFHCINSVACGVLQLARLALPARIGEIAVE